MAEKKEFKAGIYAVLVGIVLAVILAALTVFAFTTRYTGFSGEKTAQQYVDTVVQTGDGYNAYKNTLLSENKKLKYGDFIRRAYMRPYVNEKDTDGNDIPQAAFVGTGSAEEQAKIDEVYNTMYNYYVSLIKEYGWDNYDAIFSNYFAKLAEVRKTVYGDEFMNYDYMFGAFEANVATYGEYLAGAEEQLAADGKTVIKEASKGQYQEKFGDEYRFTSTVTDYSELSDEEAKAYIAAFKERIAPVAAQGEAKAEEFGIKNTTSEKKILFITKTEEHNDKDAMVDAFAKLDCADDITAVAKATVTVTLDDGTTVATQELYVVKVGSGWYVDNTNIDTSGLYLAK